MSRYALSLLALLLAACDPIVPPERTWDVDQCQRREIFQQCLKALPQGPTNVVNNDWDEVVDSCESAAYSQSVRNKTHIKPECK